MATIVVRKHGKGIRYQVKVRLKGLPCKTETFVRKTDATRWASATDVENSNRLRSRGFLFTDKLDQPIDLAAVDRLSLIPTAAQRNAVSRRPTRAE